MSYQPRRMRNDENPYRKSTKGSSNMGYSSNKNYTKSNKSSKPAKNKSGKGVVVFRILTLAYIINCRNYLYFACCNWFRKET